MRGRARMMLAMVLLSLSLSGCGILYRQRTVVFKRVDFAPVVQKLAAANPEFFDNPYTLVVMLDSRPCGARLFESIYWSDWQRHMIENGNGFVFATSRADSAGLVYAAHLDSADAPVLVLESYEKSISRINNWQGAAPFHILTDSAGSVIRVWLAAFDQNESDLLLEAIDSLIVMRANLGNSMLVE